MSRRIACAAGLAGLLIVLRSAQPVHAWSDLGHQAVCQIALLEVAPPIRKKVTEILSSRPFAAACTWADEEKNVEGTIQHARRDEHFVNVKRWRASITSEDCGQARTCLFTAIHADANALKHTTGAAQLTALKFLGHWIGDLHQPLHVSYADDRGGNDIPVSQAAGCQQLHALWDYCLPEALRQRMSASRDPTDLGRKLHAEITAAERARWRQGTLVDWAAESYAITQKADTRYCLMQGGRCCYDTHACENRVGSDEQRQTKRLTRLPHSYDDGELDTVKEQLQKAGVRLATILEATLQ